MTGFRSVSAGAALTLTVGLLGPPAAAAAAPSAISWAPCPTYSAEALHAMVPPDKLTRFAELLARLECGTVAVPLDYRAPHGRLITVALTRLKAQDQAHRLGSLALNPGGPGGSGYLMPVQLLTMGEATGIDKRYDLIGFDPRGVGYSTAVDCPPPARDPGPEPAGPLTKEAARRTYDAQVQDNAACGRSDPAFLSRLTTADVARDLDRIRSGLRERKLNFLGISWGTWLGAVYRSEFPDRVGRMFLDSVAIPRFTLPAFENGRAAAAERNALRMAAWIAERDDVYGFGRTAGRVRAAIIALRTDYDAHPRRFTDVPEPLDGDLVAVSASQDAPVWPLAAKVMAELRDATGPAAPPTVKEVVGDPGAPAEPPADLPEQSNRTMNRAAFCNEDPARLDFEADWAGYRQRLADNPMTGLNHSFSAGCAGWPLPVQPVRLRPGTSSLVLSGHKFETPSPYEWTGQTQAIVGGRVYTVRDDVHGSVLQVPGCAADLVTYFDTGRIDGGCAGVPVPTGTDEPAVRSLSRTGTGSWS
ncbi:alpha/beta hydrolase [Paractinoplanes ferrugineus]|uniref:Alpha/beta hydrolase n=1 Tax=Paractinoplanes ferrugineus TaxID=113564 RepID=A0A919MQ66_9ACTN|nr:alpha/beta hydrolase [Actinoplanes ferrugineus]GIE16022.1 alpha/beta hydrolase [Actinoplanes ferrugineus]